MQTYKDKQPNAIVVWRYKDGDDTYLPLRVSNATFAPNGIWEDANNDGGDLQNYQVTFDITDRYLNANDR